MCAGTILKARKGRAMALAKLDLVEKIAEATGAMRKDTVANVEAVLTIINKRYNPARRSRYPASEFLR